MESKATDRSGWRDGGWKSRKLWFSVFAIAVMYLGMRVAAADALLRPLYETFVGGVMGVSGMFLIGNVGAKWVSGKTVQASTSPSPKAPVASKTAKPESTPDFEESSPQ